MSFREFGVVGGGQVLLPDDSFDVVATHVVTGGIATVLAGAVGVWDRGYVQDCCQKSAIGPRSPALTMPLPLRSARWT